MVHAVCKQRTNTKLNGEKTMKRFGFLLPMLFVVALLPSMQVRAAGVDESYRATWDPGCDKNDIGRYDNELSEKDWDSLKDYINTKRTINLRDKSCNLTIAGDVRFDWRHQNERRNGKNIRGNSNRINGDEDGVRISRNDFDIEFNLYFDYVCDRAWAVAQLEFDNSAGVMPGKNNECMRHGDTLQGAANNAGGGNDGLPNPDDDYVVDAAGWKGSGYCCDICLKKAYIGYNICCECDTRFDIELGRRRLYQVFDSEVQFLSQFDGILFKYQSSWECVADWYLYLAGFIVDERSNHFAYATEVGFMNLYDCGIDFKYSFIDWKKNGYNRCGCSNSEDVENYKDSNNPVGFKFQVSQFTLKYHLDPEMVCMPGHLYGAVLWNHCPAKHIPCERDADESNESVTDDIGKKNVAWYVGLRFGDVVHCGDWAFDVQYQYVQATAIPDKDVSGIGRGNVRDDSFTDGGLRGNTNYKGWRLEALYAFTDNVSFNACVEASRVIDKSIGGSHRYSMFQLESIYAF